MATILVPMLVVMLGAALVVSCLMTPVDKTRRSSRFRAAFYGITGILFVIGGLGAVCIIAFHQ